MSDTRLLDHDMLDQDMLASLQSLLGEKFQELINAFIFDSRGRFSRLNAAQSVNDLNTIKDEAHGIKGSARNIGANQLAEICSKIEDQARLGDADGMQQKIASAEQIFAAVAVELQSYVASD